MKSIGSAQPKIDACLRTTIVGSGSANNIINSIYECLIQSRLFKVNYDVIYNRLHNKIVTLEHAKKERDYMQNFITKQDRKWREKLKSIQREMVGVYMRLQHYSSSTNVPKFTDLSASRTLDTVQNFAGSLHQVGGYVSALPKQFKETMGTIGNMSSHLKRLDEAATQEENASEEVADELNNIKHLILTLYAP